MPQAHVDTLLEHVGRCAPRPSGVRLVGIDGRSGSGKTDLATAIATRLGCALVHLDDLYAGWHGLAEAVPLLCDRVVGPLSQGRPGRYRRYDWAAGRFAETVVVPPDDLVVIEGVGALAGPCAAAYSLRVWLEAPAQARRDRALARDGGTFAPHWQEWTEQEDALFAGGLARARADLVLSTGGA